jgi:hypothetical protein
MDLLNFMFIFFYRSSIVLTLQLSDISVIDPIAVKTIYNLINILFRVWEYAISFFLID